MYVKNTKRLVTFASITKDNGKMKKATDKVISEKVILPESFFDIQAMTKEETGNHGENLKINYCFAKSPFGKIIIASTEKGICSVSLALEEETAAIKSLTRMFPKAQMKYEKELSHSSILTFFDSKEKLSKPILLHLKGTVFQLKVWKALLGIPFGGTTSYSEIATKIGHPNAGRAVGSAIGHNPIFYLIPCHRVIQSSGSIGQYYWGTAIKTSILEWEKTKLFQQV